MTWTAFHLELHLSPYVRDSVCFTAGPCNNSEGQESSKKLGPAISHMSQPRGTPQALPWRPAGGDTLSRNVAPN